MMLLLAVGSLTGCRNRIEPKQESSPAPPVVKPEHAALIRQAEQLTDEGYDLKREGRNQDALAKFEQATPLFEKGAGKESEAVAGNLDDQASIYLRTGQYRKARTLYSRAIAIQDKVAPGGSRLAASIERRLATLDALEKRHYVCHEPLVPAQESSDSENDKALLPYYPEKKALYDAYAKLDDEIRPCLPKSLLNKPVPVWTVLLGETGDIVLSRAKGSLYGTPTGQCIESTLARISSQYAAVMPRFRACYRNFTYPFILASK